MPTTHREPLCLSDGFYHRPGPSRGRSQSELPNLHCSYWLMRQTKILLSTSVSLFRQAFAGCYEPLLEDGPSRRYLCDPCIGAWVRTPPRLVGALVRFFPSSIGLPLGSRGSAPGKYPTTQLSVGKLLGAATIRLPSGSHTCLAHRLL